MDDKGVKGMLKEDMEIKEKLNELFAPVFTVEEVKQNPVFEWTFAEREFEEPRQIVVTRKDVLSLTDGLKTEKITGS